MSIQKDGYLKIFKKIENFNKIKYERKTEIQNQ